MGSYRTELNCLLEETHSIMTRLPSGIKTSSSLVTPSADSSDARRVVSTMATLGRRLTGGNSRIDSL